LKQFMKYGRNNFVPDLTHGLSKPVNPHKTSRRPHTTPAALFFSPAGEHVMGCYGVPATPPRTIWPLLLRTRMPRLPVTERIFCCR